MHETYRKSGGFVRVAVGAGSNVEPRHRHLRRARRRLGELLRGITCSRAYVSPPAEGVGGGPFLNLCCVGGSDLGPMELVRELQALEIDEGRAPPGSPTRGGPRTLDLDLLLYGEETVETDGLRVPHPRLTTRAFVLLPLAEVAHGWPVPGTGATVGELARRVNADRVRDVGELSEIGER